MATFNLAQDWYIEELEVGTIAFSGGTLKNAAVASDAAIASSKLVNRIIKTYTQADGSNVASTSGDGYAIYVCDRTNGATIKKVSAMCPDVGSGGAPVHNIAIDIKMYDYSGTSLATVLSSVVNITESELDYETVNGTLASTAMDQGDVLMVQVTVTGSGGTNPQGLLVQVELDESGT